MRAPKLTPGTVAVLGVIALLASGVLDERDLAAAARLQWRALLALASIMVITGVVEEVGAFERLAAWIERGARARSAVRTFTLIYALSWVTAALLNNDAAILLLTPLVIALTRRLYPGRTDVTVAFAFAVFLAPGVAPMPVSNPMNMIAVDCAHLDWATYTAVMLPISLACAALVYAILRRVFRRALSARAASAITLTRVHRHPAEVPAVAVALLVFAAYPFAGPIVAVAGALAALVIARAFRVAPLPKVARHVSLDILAFLWAVFLVVESLRSAGLVSALHVAYAPRPGQLALVGGVSALGSAVVNNHPMSILNLLAIGGDTRALLAALIGGDLGPRLLPIGSLAGLLWLDLLRRAGVRISLRRFCTIGALTAVPALALAIAMLWAWA
jgi:arsenical pump membrane protein